MHKQHSKKPVNYKQENVQNQLNHWSKYIMVNIFYGRLLTKPTPGM